MKKLLRHIKWFYQRITRGFDDRECWNLNTTIAKFLIPRLKVFKTNTHTFPSEISLEEWDIALLQMIDAFELYILDNDDLNYDDVKIEFDEKGHLQITKDPDKEKVRNTIIESRRKRIEDGLNLFREYFYDLWD
jgi:hypothetical protein